MVSGTLLMASLLLAAAHVPSDATCFNHRNLRIPIGIHPDKRQEISQLILFVSSDQGKTWHKEAVVPPENDDFLFYAPTDGMYWLRVAVVNKQGKQEPEDITKGLPDQKVLIDTLKPMIRIASAKREGDEVAVAWEIQEEYPDLPSLQLEYRPADGPSSLWSAVTIPQALISQARVRPNTAGPLVLRLQLKDQAGNLSYTEADVPGSNGVTAASFQPSSTPAAVPLPPPAAPAPFPGPPPEVKSTLVAAATSAGAPRAPERMHSEGSLSGTTGSSLPPPVQMLPDPVPPAPEPGTKIVARSDAPPRPPAPAPAPAPVPAAPSAPVEPARPPLPTVRLVNNPGVVLEYQLDKVGPSGIGSVDLWMTQTDGQTWTRWAEDPEVKALTSGGKYQRTVELPGEGVYGFRLVVKSRAGRGRPAPTSGDVPEIRIEVDTTPPVAQLFEPVPDPKQRDALLIRWTAKDKNLAAKPITLEYAERPDGEWHEIVKDFPNAPEGYAWQVPPNIPVSVYLRLRVRDEAGNEGVAVTGEPQLVDLSEPEGHLLTATATPRNP